MACEADDDVKHEARKAVVRHAGQSIVMEESSLGS
jgi:hypothetical protein